MRTKTRFQHVFGKKMTFAVARLAVAIFFIFSEMAELSLTKATENSQEFNNPEQREILVDSHMNEFKLELEGIAIMTNNSRELKINYFRS